MLDRELVFDFFSDLPSLFRRSMLREYLQYKTLQYIYESSFGSGLVFMGGTAIHVFYGCDRFSEDLDFDNRSLTAADFSSLGECIARRFSLENVACKADLHIGRAFTIRLRFRYILQRWELTGHPDELMMIKVDAFPQDYDCPPSIRLLNRLDAIAKIPVTPPAVLLSQKLHAILTRKRLMGRDVYDTSWLLGQTSPDYTYLKKHDGIGDGTELQERILDRIQSVSIASLVRDVEPFIPDRSGLLRLETFLEQLEEI